MCNWKKTVLIFFALQSLLLASSLADELTLDGPDYQGLTLVSI